MSVHLLSQFLLFESPNYLTVSSFLDLPLHHSHDFLIAAVPIYSLPPPTTLIRTYALPDLTAKKGR
jgi:hypothetical protein